MVRRSTKGADLIEAGEPSFTRFADRLRKRLGEDSVTLLSGDRIAGVKDWVSTQHPMIDAAIGHTGLPVGRITTIFGETSCGKTTLSYHILGETQRRGGIAILIDAENAALDAARAAQLGVNPDELMVLQPETLEDACKMMEEAINFAREDFPDKIVTIIFDSVAGIATKAEAEGEYGQHHMAQHAKIMGQALRKITGLIAQQNICLVIINQYRDNIGVTFGPSKTMIAEKPIRFFASVAMEIARVSILNVGEGENKTSYGIQCKAYINKNKVAKPFETGHFRILWTCGIDSVQGVFAAGVKTGIIARPSAGWYEYKDKKFRETQFEATVLKEYPQIVGEILSSLGLPEAYTTDSKLMNLSDEVSIGEPELEFAE